MQVSTSAALALHAARQAADVFDSVALLHRVFIFGNCASGEAEFSVNFSRGVISVEPGALRPAAMSFLHEVKAETKLDCELGAVRRLFACIALLSILIVRSAVADDAGAAQADQPAHKVHCCCFAACLTPSVSPWQVLGRESPDGQLQPSEAGAQRQGCGRYACCRCAMH
jgi:hypothetical protein